MHSDPWENIVVYDYVINHTFMIRVNLRTINIFHTLSHWYMLPALAFRLDSVVFVQCGLVWFGLWCLTPRHLQLYFRYIMEVSFIRGGNRRKPPICHWQTLSHIIIHFLYLMNINKDILAFYWLCFVMWFYFIFHGMTTKSSKEVIMYHVILHWPVDIDRLKKLKWRPINPVLIEIWNSIQLLHFIEYACIQQYFSYVVAVSSIGGGSRRTRRKPPTCRKYLTNFISYTRTLFVCTGRRTTDATNQQTTKWLAYYKCFKSNLLITKCFKSDLLITSQWFSYSFVSGDRGPYNWEN
jgi:hypothetical protein